MCITEKESGDIGTHKILQEVTCKKITSSFSLKGLGVDGKDGRPSMESLISAFALGYLLSERQLAKHLPHQAAVVYSCPWRRVEVKLTKENTHREPSLLSEL